MLTLLQLLLTEVAAHHRVAVLVDAVGEVLAGHTDRATTNGCDGCRSSPQS